MHPKLRSILLCALTLILTASAARAQTTIHVPADQPTIQAGINAANTGDTVLVAPGTYFEHLNFNGKAITVTSTSGTAGGAANTIIDGGGTGTVVYLSAPSPDKLAVFDGFTVQHGYPDGVGGAEDYNDGGAIDADGNAIVRNNIITTNTSCGVDILDGNVTVQNNHISNNVGANTAGGDCRINGYGILAHDNLTIRTTISLLNNLIETNYDGGIGLFNLDASTTVNIFQNVIRNNGVKGSYDGGAGISVGDFAEVNIVGNLITGNEGIGVSQYLNYSLTLVNNTIYANSVDFVAQYPYQGSEVNLGILDFPGVLSNNIIVGTSATQPVVYCANATVFQAPFNWDHSLIYDTATHTGSIPCDTDPSAGNIFLDPLLRSPASSDFRPTMTSPVVDAGNNGASFVTATDLDGNPRVQDAKGSGCIIDMGAYEYPGTVGECSTAETLTSSLNPSTVGQTVTFTAQLSSTKGTPTGDVQFADGSTVLASTTIDATGASAYSTSQLSVGSHTITATYQPTGVFSAASASLVQVVNDIAPATTNTTLTCDPTTLTVGATSLLTAMVTSTGGTPTGAIAFTDNSDALTSVNLSNGAAAFTYTGANAGMHTLTATYVPTGNFSPGSSSCTIQVNAPAPSGTLRVTSNQNPAPAYSPIKFAAVLIATPVPNGSFYLTIGSNPPVAMMSSRAGNGAIYTTSSLAPGTYVVTATFVPTGNAPEITARLVPDEVVVVAVDDFTITGPATIAATTESIATGFLSLTSVAGFVGTVNTSCSLPAPMAYQCTLDPAAVPLTAYNTSYTTVKIGPIRNPSAASLPLSRSQRTTLATLFPLTVFSLLALARRRRFVFRSLLSLFVLALFAASTTACGPDKFYAAIAPGNYPLTITASGTASGTTALVTHTLNMTLVIKP